MRRRLALMVVIVILASTCREAVDQAAPHAEPERPIGAVVSLADDGATLTLGAGAEITVGGTPPVLDVSDNGTVITQATLPHLVRGDLRVDIEVVTAAAAITGGAELTVTFGDGTAGSLQLRAAGERTAELRVILEDTEGITAWGDRFALGDNELVYGLTERIVADLVDSELEPAEVGSLDRRGEIVDLWVAPTISAYTPFHHSSAGYGLAVDSTFRGTYDIGVTDSSTLAFEFALEPGAETPPGEASFGLHLFVGDHDEILDGYTALTGRPFRPPARMFEHWRGQGLLAVGLEPVTVDGVEIHPDIAEDLDWYERLDLPAGNYDFDRPWATGGEGYGELEFDPERFPDAERMLGLLASRGWALGVWQGPWVLDDRAATAAANGWLAPGSTRILDLTGGDAVDALTAEIDEFLRSSEGRYIDFFRIDRGDEMVPSSLSDVYADYRTGLEIHNAYPEMLVAAYDRALSTARREDTWLVARAAFTGSQVHAALWGGDTISARGGDAQPSTDLGLRSVLISMQRAAFMGFPYWGSNIGGLSDYGDREVFARSIEIGALSPLMRFGGEAGNAPWASGSDHRVDGELIDIYARYVRLHHDLVPYLDGLAAATAATGTPLVRPLVFDYPDEPAAQDRWDQYQLGPDLLVAPIWRSGDRQRRVWIPPGTWLDFWHRDSLVEGPVEIDVDAPLDEIPLFVRQGSDLADLDPPG